MSTLNLPFSQAAENNAPHILKVLQEHIAAINFQPQPERTRLHLLEVGSGTGQHSVFMAPQLEQQLLTSLLLTQRFSGICWHTSDLQENLANIRQRLHWEKMDNILNPLELNAAEETWPQLPKLDIIYSANTLHIMSWPEALSSIEHIANKLSTGGLFVVYGPFNYQGQYSSRSNAQFDLWLKSINPQRGIRNFEEVTAHAQQFGLELLKDHAMPANNRCLVFQKNG